MLFFVVHEWTRVSLRNKAAMTTLERLLRSLGFTSRQVRYRQGFIDRLRTVFRLSEIVFWETMGLMSANTVLVP